jgi:hypothetical protein
MPKLIFTNTSGEYWTRAASLLHTDVDGIQDLGHDPDVRIYFIAGGQHGVTTGVTRGIYTNLINQLDHRPILRALLVVLDDWATRGVEPPPSRYPRIDDGTLVDVEAYRSTFPTLPGVVVPVSPYTPARLDLGPMWESEGIISTVPARSGSAFRSLVPAPDADGNDRAGVRLPDVAVPLATFTGWNLRAAEAGAEGQLARFNGSYVPFESSADDRVSAGDPRQSVLERFPSFKVYFGMVAEAAVELACRRFLLNEDVVRVLRTAEKRRGIWPDPAGN